MKITKSQLKQIIKEELESVLQEYETRARPGASYGAHGDYNFMRNLMRRAAEEEEVPAAAEEEVELTDDEKRKAELEAMYSGEREPSWLEQMGWDFSEEDAPAFGDLQ